MQLFIFFVQRIACVLQMDKFKSYTLSVMRQQETCFCLFRSPGFISKTLQNIARTDFLKAEFSTSAVNMYRYSLPLHLRSYEEALLSQR